MTELIITGSLVGIAQNIISLRSLLEFLFGILVSGITTRMILDRFLAVGFLYFIGGSVFATPSTS